MNNSDVRKMDYTLPDKNERQSVFKYLSLLFLHDAEKKRLTRCSIDDYGFVKRKQSSASWLKRSLVIRKIFVFVRGDSQENSWFLIARNWENLLLSATEHVKTKRLSLSAAELVFFSMRSAAFKLQIWCNK